MNPAVFAEGLRYTPGAYGIAATSFRLWTEIATGDKIVTIAEDDAIFRPDFHAVLMDLRQQLVGDFDFVTWGYNFDSVVRAGLFENQVPCRMTFNQDALRVSLTAFRTDRCQVTLQRLLEFYGIFAYSISPSGARELLKRCFPLTDDNHYSPGLGRVMPQLGIDIVMNRHYGDLRCFMAYPPMVVTPNLLEATTVQCF
ncbi:hypothetical protein WK13_31750 [Burkholderia ubonensis]|nr:hypothetical protein WK13_31750 [Burkholderia ubonensis]